MPVRFPGRTCPQPVGLADSSRGQAQRRPRVAERRRFTHPEGVLFPGSSCTLSGCVGAGVAWIRWRRPPEADLPPATVWQAFSLQEGRIRPSRCARADSRSCVEQQGCQPVEQRQRKHASPWGDGRSLRISRCRSASTAPTGAWGLWCDALHGLAPSLFYTSRAVLADGARSVRGGPSPQPEGLADSSRGQVRQGRAPPPEPASQTHPTLEGSNRRRGGIQPFQGWHALSRRTPVAASAGGGLATGYCRAGLQPAGNAVALVFALL